MNKHLDSEAYYEKSCTSHDACKYTESILLYKRAITSKPNHYDAHFQWGRNLTDNGIYDRSVIKHKEIVARNPTDYNAYYNLGVTLERKDEFLKAEIQYKKSLEINSSFQDACHNLAIALTKQAKYTEALEQYEKNIESNPDDSSTENCYGYLKFILGQYEEAIKSFDNAIQKDSQYSLPLINKSIVLHCLGKDELAAEVFKESIGKVGAEENWQKRLQKNVMIYQKELRRLMELSESDDLGEVNRDKLEINIKALQFIVNLLLNEQNKEEKDGQ